MHDLAIARLHGSLTARSLAVRVYILFLVLSCVGDEADRVRHKQYYQTAAGRTRVDSLFSVASPIVKQPTQKARGAEFRSKQNTVECHFIFVFVRNLIVGQ